MSTPQREMLSKWLPLIVALVTNFIVVAYGYGKLEQRLAPVETHVSVDTTERALALFITRAEFQQRSETRDRELADLKVALQQMNQKLDRILERQTGKTE